MFLPFTVNPVNPVAESLEQASLDRGAAAEQPFPGGVRKKEEERRASKLRAIEDNLADAKVMGGES